MGNGSLPAYMSGNIDVELLQSRTHVTVFEVDLADSRMS